KRLENPAMGFGISMTCLGLFGIIYFPWLSTWCFQLAPGINDRVFGNMLEVPAVQSLVPPLYYSIFLFLLPSIAMGIGFPLALQAWSKYHHKVGQTTGIVYGANTIGAVLGGIVTGFLLIPKNGAQLSITILGIIGVWLGALMLQAFAVKIRIRTRVAFMATAITLTIAAIMIPLGIFEQKIVSRPDINTLAVREGLTTTVAVNRKEDGTLALTSDGVNIAGDGGHRVAQKMLGHLGPFLNINAKEVLSVGFGSGETTACLSRHNFERIDCVEIAPEVVDVALDYFSHINLGDKLNEKVNMIYMDGKNYLYLTDKKYDIIINGADVPTYPGSAPMFGKEHFQNALNHLNPGGLFITKLHLSGIPVPCFDSILGTFVETFRHTTIWFPTTKAFSFFYIVGSEDEQSFSLKHIAKQLKDENIRGSVSFLNWQNDLDVMTCYIGDENDILRYLKGYNVNSDYLPFVEFSYTAKSKQDLFRGGLAEQFVKTVRGDSILNHIDWSGVSDETRQLWLSKQKTSYQAASHILDAAFTKDSFLILRSISKALQFAPDKQELVEWLDKGLNDLKEAIEKSPPNAVLPKLEAELRKSPDFGAVWLASSWVLQRKNVHGNALDAAKKAVLYMPYSKLARENLNAISKKSAKIESSSPFKLAILAIQQNKIEDAILHFDHALTLKPQRSEVLNNLAWLRAVYNGRNSFDPSKAVKHALKACELTQYKKANYIDTLAIAYAANGDFSKAVEMEKRAIEIANLSKQQNLIENFQKHLSLFKKSKPYHESIK
ncbi:MAG: hypothetical protein K9M75_13105, partial [Phycisphaerae bacterium]|nr:hypothetical protein [Phycisphaerae bacterium]